MVPLLLGFAGVATAAGVSCGQLVWTLASAVGLAALLQTSQVLLGWLKLLGARYLISSDSAR